LVGQVLLYTEQRGTLEAISFAKEIIHYCENSPGEQAYKISKISTNRPFFSLLEPMEGVPENHGFMNVCFPINYMALKTFILQKQVLVNISSMEEETSGILKKFETNELMLTAFSSG